MKQFKSKSLTCTHYEGASFKPYRDFVDHSYISLPNKYFFHTIGKAANSSLKAIFYDYELKRIHWKSPSVHDRIASPLLSPFQLSEIELEKVFFGNDFTRFLFVRNPYSRLLSCFLDRIKDTSSRPYQQLCLYTGNDFSHGFTFGEFIVAICSQTDFQQNNHWRLMYADALCSIIPYNFIGKQENFSSDISKLLKVLGLESIHLNLTDRSHSPATTNSESKFSQYWTKELISLVSNRYKEDFDFFGYEYSIDF